MGSNISETPFVSIIIPHFFQMECSSNSKFPFYSFEKPIEGCLESANAQDYPYKEVILADKDRGLGSADMRNVAIQRAKGELIFFCDADVIIADPHTISKLIQVFKETGADAIIGGSVPSREKSPYFIYLLQLEYEERENNMGEGEVDAGATTYMGVKRGILDKIGGLPIESPSIHNNIYFDTAFLDWDFCGLLKEKGYRIWHTNKFKVIHILQTKMGSYFIKQAHSAWFRMGYIKRFKKITEGYTKYKMIMPMFFLATLPLWIILGIIVHPLWFNALCVVFGLTFFWNIDSVLRFYKKTKDRGVFLLLPISFLRFIAWEIGGIKGFIDFYLLRRFLPKREL